MTCASASMTGSRVGVAISSLLTTRSHRALAWASVPIIVHCNDGRQWHTAASRVMQDAGKWVDRKMKLTSSTSSNTRAQALSCCKRASDVGAALQNAFVCPIQLRLSLASGLEVREARNSAFENSCT